MNTQIRFNLKLASFIIILLLTSIACSVFSGNSSTSGNSNASGNSSNSNNSNSNGSDSGEQEQESELPPVPLDLTQMVTQGVEQGEWTEGEGLAAALKILMGQSEPPGWVEAPIGVDYHSGWGISNIASIFLDSDAPDEEKAEVERLMNILAPSDEVLEKYAAPAGTSQSKSPGLAVPFDPQVECTSLWTEGFDGALFDPPICLEYAESPTYSGGRARAYYLREASTDAAVQAAVSNSLDALIDSVGIYGSLGLELKSINLIFTQIDVEASTYAFVPNRSSSDIRLEPCPVLVFPFGVELNSREPEKFKQIIAHEVFHCTQFWRYQSLNLSTVAWWAEGTATYFSNLVYPTTNQEYEYIGDFDEVSPDGKLNNHFMRYGNFLFFMYLGNQNGPSQVLAMTDSLTNRYGGAGTESSGSSQLQALSGFPGIQDLFHDFGQNYLDRRLFDTGGGLLPVNPRRGETLRYPENTIDPSALPFVLTRYQLIFDEGHEYQLDIFPNGGPGRSAVRPSEIGDSWGPMPEEVFASCGTAQYNLIITSTAPSEADEHFLSLNVMAGEELGCDDCLVGHWERSTEEFNLIFFESFLGLPNLKYINSTAVLAVDIYEDATTLFRPLDYTIHYLGLLDTDTPTDNLVQIGGYVVGNYGITEEGKIKTWSLLNGFNLISTLTSTIRGQTITTETAIDISSLQGFGFPIPFNFFEGDYTCAGNTLTADNPDIGPLPESNYRRISRIPDPLPEGAADLAGEEAVEEVP